MSRNEGAIQLPETSKQWKVYVLKKDGTFFTSPQRSEEIAKRVQKSLKKDPDVKSVELIRPEEENSTTDQS